MKGSVRMGVISADVMSTTKAGRKLARQHRRHISTIFAGLLGAGFLYASGRGAQAQAIELGELNGQNGFKMYGPPGDFRFGKCVSGVGDINGDQIDDMIVAASNSSTSAPRCGSVYVILGNVEPTTNVLDLNSLDGSNGFRVDGSDAYGFLGISVGGGGDVNNDGFKDIILGSYAGPGGLGAGVTYVIFGKSSFTSATLNVSELDGSNGIQIHGIDINDRLGQSVANAGDVNDDGFDDVIIGSHFVNDQGANAGAAYVVFGKSTFSTSTIQLADIDGTNGFLLQSEGTNFRTGRAVAGAGDVNNDGIDDVIVGAPQANKNGSKSGSSYVVFGKAGATSGVLALSSLDGTNGFRIDGATVNEYSGYSMASAGDFNGDGINDIVIGCPYGSGRQSFDGISYIVFGKSTFPASFNCSAIDGTNGVRFLGERAANFSGCSVSGAEDFNGDGLDDLVVGAYLAGPNDSGCGSSYVLFGRTSFTTSTIDLSSVDGTQGLRFDGERIHADDESGRSVAVTGDVNGDGVADLIIGAPRNDTNGASSGAAYVVFGPTPLVASKLKIGLNFAKPAKDSISIKGTIPIPAGFALTNPELSINVGGTTKVLTLDDKGSAKTGADKFKIKIKSKNGVVEAQDAPFTISFKKGDFALSLADEGLINADLSVVPLGVGVWVSFADKLYHAMAPLSYSAKQGKTGKAK